MADAFNALQSSGIQAPVFRSNSSHNAKGDDLDLNEIFQEYFNDSDDPLASVHQFSNAYTEFAAATIAQQQQKLNQQQNDAVSCLSNQAPQAIISSNNNSNNSSQLNLPTGRGIKTPWHAGTLSALQPPSKQIKLESSHQNNTENLTTHNAQPMSTAAQFAQPFQTSTSTMTPSRSLSDRLGFSIAGTANHNNSTNQNQPSHSTIQRLANSSSSLTKTESNNKLALPVGVGIRFGLTPSSSAQNVNIANPKQSSMGDIKAAAGLNNSQWTNSTQNQFQNASTQPTPPSSTILNNPFLRAWSGLSDGKGQASEKAAADRRHRNREHAKRSRVRKKFLLESLQQQVASLQKENQELRILVQTKIPQKAQQIISECCAKSVLFEDDGTDGKEKTDLVKSDFTLMSNLTTGQQNFVLSDPRLPDNPIVYASEGFYKLTGYTSDQVLGRNCRFLQGPGTDPKAVDVIRTAVANGTDATTCILNYKADGTPFWNQFFMAALRDSDNCIVNYVGVQCEIESDAGATALEDKVNAVLPLQVKGSTNDLPSGKAESG